MHFVILALTSLHLTIRSPGFHSLAKKMMHASGNHAAHRVHAFGLLAIAASHERRSEECILCWSAEPASQYQIAAVSFSGKENDASKWQPCGTSSPCIWTPRKRCQS